MKEVLITFDEAEKQINIINELIGSNLTVPMDLARIYHVCGLQLAMHNSGE